MFSPAHGLMEHVAVVLIGRIPLFDRHCHSASDRAAMAEDMGI